MSLQTGSKRESLNSGDLICVSLYWNRRFRKVPANRFVVKTAVEPLIDTDEH